eukprot:7265376-Prymnesium_polylepis.2
MSELESRRPHSASSAYGLISNCNMRNVALTQMPTSTRACSCASEMMRTNPLRVIFRSISTGSYQKATGPVQRRIHACGPFRYATGRRLRIEKLKGHRTRAYDNRRARN